MSGYINKLNNYYDRALGKIAEFIDFQEPGIIKKFQDLVPNMVGVLEQALVKNDEDNAAKGFEVFDNLLYLVILKNS